MAARHRAGPRGGPPRAGHPGLRLRLRRSRSGAAPAPTSAARRRRSSTASRASAASRATSRRSRSRSGSSASRPWSTTSRRWPTCRSSCARAARPTPRIGTEGSTGPKLFCLSGNVARPGVYEVDFGATLRRPHRRWPAASTGGRAIQAILLGGAAGVFVGPDQLDMPLTFEGTRAAGATLGSGVDHGLRRDRGPARDRCAASPASSATSRAASACPAGSAPSARRSSSHRLAAGPPERHARRRAAPLRRDRPGDARRLDLRPRPDGRRRPSSRRFANLGACRLVPGRRARLPTMTADPDLVPARRRARPRSRARRAADAPPPGRARRSTAGAVTVAGGLDASSTPAARRASTRRPSATSRT